MTLYEDVARTLKRLAFIREDAYYALFMIGLNKRETTKVPTLAVGLQDNEVTLYINPDFWFSMTENQKFGVCKHEMLHLCFFHLVTQDAFPFKMLDNIATDYEINQYINPDYLPEGCVNADFIKLHFNKVLPPKMGRQFYYKELLDCIPPEFQIPSNIIHNWDEIEKLDSVQQEILKSHIEWLMEETAQTVEKGRPGSTPGEIQVLLDLIKKPPVFDWKKYVRGWVGNSNDVYVKQTRFKPNPYFTQNPANKIKMRQNILFAIDTSGSVSNEELQECMSELYNLWKFGHTISIMCADTKLYDPYIYKGENTVKIHGRGGTTFTPTLEFFNQNKQYNAMIYFTDGYAELPPNANRSMLWIISSNGSDEAIKEHNGKILKIPKQ